MTKTKQTKQELLAHLNENLGFLRMSAVAFDGGFYGEAKRLAVSVRVLVHDTPQSKSLLGLLGFKAGMAVLNTSIPYDKNNILGHHGLVGIKLGGGDNRYFAPLGDGSPARPNKYVLFPDWWNDTVIVDKYKSKFSRRELVMALANKDGGAHVDPELDQRYADLTRNNSIGWILSDGTEERPMGNIELHSMRQIAYEMISSVERRAK